MRAASVSELSCLTLLRVGTERNSSIVSGLTEGEGGGLGQIASQELNIIPEEDSQIDANSSHRSKAPSEHEMKSQQRSTQNSAGITPKQAVNTHGISVAGL